MKVKSFKFNLIFFAVFSAIVVGIVINAKIKNSNVIQISNKTRVKDIKSEEIKKQQLKENEIKKQQQIKKEQENLEKKWMIGYNQFFEKKYEKAIETEGQVLKEDSTFYKAYAVKGIALSYSGKFKEGMQQIDKALELKPTYGYARFNKALANELYGYYDEAIKWYKRDLEVEKFEWSYYGIASIYGRKGDIDNTVKYLKLAIDINSNIKDIAKDEKDFDKVKDRKEFKQLIGK